MRVAEQSLQPYVVGNVSFIDGSKAGDPKSSPKDSNALLPLALAFLAVDGSEGGFTQLKTDVRTWAKRDPIDALLAMVVGGGIAFYMAERDTNPACATPWDGILYMSTSLSVGYDNLFPTTTTGHMLATICQTFGPALAAQALEEPAGSQPDTNAQILARLDEIVRLLSARTDPH
jgi:voltage-gated potassium channel